MMWSWYMLATITGVSCAYAQPLPPMHAPISGIVTFDDEFDKLDLSKYTTSYPWGARWLETEQQVYVDPSASVNPFSIIDGMLHIEARPVSPPLFGKQYTSGLLTTFYSFSQQYGYVEIRAKMPAGKGYWPAFWLIPTKWSPQHPPEIDVVEVLGDRLHTLYATAHWNNGREHQFPITVPDLSAGFHRYGASWDENYVAWYFDGERVAYLPTPPDLKQPMYILLNLAVGGKWPGYPTPATKFPGAFVIDYVRVYKLNEEGH
jgi:beta-glucanase (GH16 family)